MDEPGVISPGKVNVLIECGDCSVAFLPELGGKISSILVKGHELLQAPLAEPAGRDRAMTFDDSDASGWDECLPSVAGCTVETAAGTASVPDHGDLWRVEWKMESVDPARVAMHAECFSLPLTLERTTELSETCNGWRLHLHYKLTNCGTFATPWSWSAHPLFAVEPGDEIVLPESIRELRLEGSGGGRLGKAGDTVTWPVATLTNGSRADLRIAQPAESGIGDKLFAGPLKDAESWCALVRAKAGVRIRVSFDAAATPYLGLWICYGGWPERPGPRQMCVAPEPCTAPVDSLAQGGDWSRVLNPGGSFVWTMTIDLELL